MTKDELLNDLLELLSRRTDIESAGKIDGESAIGIETTDGTEYFLTLDDA